MNLIQTVAPINEPISLDEAKIFMHILEDDEDELITSMIVAAREYAENYTNRQLVTATFELTNYCLYSGFILPKAPFQSISKIEYINLNGNTQIMSTDDYYDYQDNGISKLWINVLPTTKEDMRAFKITFISGYVEVPSSIKTYMKMLVSTLYENREQYVVGVSINTNANPMIDKMLDFYRVRAV